MTTHDWQYCNCKVPVRVAFMMHQSDVLSVVLTLTGCEANRIIDATTGSSPFGPYEEADVRFVSGEEHYLLSYDYMYKGLDDDDTARIFRSYIMKED